MKYVSLIAIVLFVSCSNNPKPVYVQNLNTQVTESKVRLAESRLQIKWMKWFESKQDSCIKTVRRVLANQVPPNAGMFILSNLWAVDASDLPKPTNP